MGILSHLHIGKAHLQCSEVNDAVDIRVVLEDFVERSRLCDIDVVEIWALAADEWNAINGLLRGIPKIVSNDNLVVGFKECKGCE